MDPTRQERLQTYRCEVAGPGRIRLEVRRDEVLHLANHLFFCLWLDWCVIVVWHIIFLLPFTIIVFLSFSIIFFHFFSIILARLARARDGTDLDLFHPWSDNFAQHLMEVFVPAFWEVSYDVQLPTYVPRGPVPNLRLQALQVRGDCPLVLVLLLFGRRTAFLLILRWLLLHGVFHLFTLSFIFCS
ncbi:hypothetical protein B0H63DRAFT_470851 [Podospora didyma]|uniref:Transmembrane protein n=1 Tax=Podospora didyma TaxID=330526 RepID=A0AAE0NUM6_9PEZI|nr:hypothetical protein B0H63DRAFT_470851 [Podospora didyma]